MNVAIFSPYIMRMYGGLERASYWLYKSLKSRGNDVTFLTCPYKEHEPSRYNFTHTPKNVVVNLGGSRRQKEELKSKLRNGKYDCVVVFACHKIAPYICDALSETKIPWVYAERNDPAMMLRAYGIYFKNPEEKRNDIIKNCSSMVLQIGEYENTVRKEHRSKLRIIPNVCGIKKEYDRKTNCCKKILLSMGRLENSQKQLSMLIDAFDIASSGINEWELHIYGNGPAEETLKRLARSKKSNSKIKFLGVSKTPSLQYATSDVLCLPSKFEGFPNVVIEAFTHALPVVAFKDCTASRNIIKDGYNGILADKMDANSLASSLKTVMSSPELVDKLSAGAEETSKEYCEDTILNMWSDAIKLAMKNRNHIVNGGFMTENMELYVMRKPGREQDGLKELISVVEEKLGRGLKMVEIGSYAGESSKIWAESGVFKKVICVDAWKNGYDEKDYASKTAELAEKKFDEVADKYPCIEKRKCDSLTAAKLFENESLDLVYIDAMHTYDAVKADIDAWLPKVKRGGIISGHDYSPHRENLVRAVNEKLGKPDKIFNDTSWMVFISEDL